jgi:hypothetical protein
MPTLRTMFGGSHSRLRRREVTNLAAAFHKLKGTV